MSGKPKILPEGYRHEKLQVIKASGVDGNHNSLSLCRCDCGKIVIVKNKDLRNTPGHRGVKSCGCSIVDYQNKRKTVKVGMKFGRLTVIEETKMRRNGSKYYFRAYLCQCSCDGTVIVPSSALTLNRTRSCGCLRKEAAINHNKKYCFKHGMNKTRVHKIWSGMVGRCTNKENVGYPNYGGRGIKVCRRWNSFNNFYKDMGDPPSKRHSLDRINNNGNYTKTNCRWATHKQQANNRRNNVYIKFNNVTKTLAEWATLIGLTAGGLRIRIRKYGIKKAFSFKKMTYSQATLYRYGKFIPIAISLK